ncbi:MAG: transposase, partial [Psychrobacillus sp.]
GRPSIDPVVLIKMTFIQYTFGIRSMQAMLTLAALNLKKLASWTWKTPKMA